MLSNLNIPDSVKAQIMQQLGVSESHIQDALEVAQRSEHAGSTPFLTLMTQAIEYLKTSPVWEKFQTLHSIRDQVKCIGEMVSTNSHLDLKIQSVIQPAIESNNTNNNNSSISSYRADGNKEFKKREFSKALVLYNQAIRTSRGDELGFAIANRSAVYFQQREYMYCINDCEACILFHYPANMQYKILERQGRCYINLGLEQKAQDCLTQSLHLVTQSGMSKQDIEKFREGVQVELNKKIEKKETKKQSKEQLTVTDPHPECENINKALEVNYTEEKGRFTVTQDNILPGCVLLKDTPVTWFLSFNCTATNCTHCCTAITINRPYYPNPLFGIDPALFCSLTCLKQALDTYLPWESKLNLKKIFQMDEGKGCDEISGGLLLTLRLFTQHKKHLFMQLQSEEKLVPEFSSQLERVQTVFGMVRHKEVRNKADLLSVCLKTTFVIKLLLQCGYLDGDLVSNENLDIAELVYKTIQAVQYNTHPIDQATGVIRPDSHINLVELGSAVYPRIATSCNHSCDPSTVRLNIGKDVYLVSRRHIFQNQEISDCYGFHYTSLETKERKRRIKRWYNFDCKCTACTLNYPVLAGLESTTSKQVKELMERVRKQLETKNPACLQSTIQFLSLLQEKNFKHPHKAYEAGSHLLSCSLWSQWGNKAT
ncbi:SET and MYND domain-containing protein 4 isoform X1 [Eurytemora carolleeae]|uniref:SET and MYND domain-containing protein 4 isoform X1 n=1 Tax=Eurytemora carolleeae TaxID=1294199 RepID=UPI000C763708|nr:SET and MYND domain-containing protein 4 isoform X1 [Eurytemora carolleeae]|eukprot:XP_023324175.1 SET and MYND domain-containing protein 4-like isoform X1 [Eurytemora affinis]